MRESYLIYFLLDLSKINLLQYQKALRWISISPPIWQLHAMLCWNHITWNISPVQQQQRQLLLSKCFKYRIGNLNSTANYIDNNNNNGHTGTYFLPRIDYADGDVNQFNENVNKIYSPLDRHRPSPYSPTWHTKAKGAEKRYESGWTWLS